MPLPPRTNQVGIAATPLPASLRSLQSVTLAPGRHPGTLRSAVQELCPAAPPHSSSPHHPLSLNSHSRTVVPGPEVVGALDRPPDLLHSSGRSVPGTGHRAVFTGFRGLERGHDGPPTSITNGFPPSLHIQPRRSPTADTVPPT